MLFFVIKRQMQEDAFLLFVLTWYKIESLEHRE
jgi:hypothetical protein